MIIFKNKKAAVGLSLLVLVPILHFVSLQLGLYSAEIIWVDKVLHFLVGASLLLISSTVISNARSAFIAVVGLAIVWEILEYLFFILYPGTAHNLQVFSPSIAEAAMDVAFNALGAGITIIIFSYKKI